VLVVSVVALTTLTLVVATMVISGGRESDMASRRLQEARSLYAADSGASIALREIKRATDFDADGAVGSVSNDANSANDPQIGGAGGGRVRVTPAGANTYTVSSLTGFAARAFSLSVTPSSTTLHSDGFEGYTTGQALTGAGGGGWAPWDNAAGAPGYCGNTYARNGVKSQEVRNTTDSVYTYNVTSGQWVYTAWQFIPAATTGTDHYFILLNTYSPGGGKSWSTQLRFILSSNTVCDNMTGGVTGTSRTIVRDQWVPITVNLDLTAGTQSVYYNSQLLFTGSWNRGGGQRRLQAVDLYGSSATRVYYDDISLQQAGGGGGGGFKIAVTDAP